MQRRSDAACSCMMEACPVAQQDLTKTTSAICRSKATIQLPGREAFRGAHLTWHLLLRIILVARLAVDHEACPHHAPSDTHKTAILRASEEISTSCVCRSKLLGPSRTVQEARTLSVRPRILKSTQSMQVSHALSAYEYVGSRRAVLRHLR